jgi:E3 SUMO-protein ligase PIAS1
MNDTAVTASLRGIKKKPGTAPPAPVSNAKIGTPSRTSTSTPTGPVGSYALKLSPPNASNKVELVYMNTEKTYYMIVYFVETFSVEQVVEKIKKEKFRQKEDVLKSSRSFCQPLSTCC